MCLNNEHEKAIKFWAVSTAHMWAISSEIFESVFEVRSFVLEAGLWKCWNLGYFTNLGPNLRPNLKIGSSFGQNSSFSAKFLTYLKKRSFLYKTPVLAPIFGTKPQSAFIFRIKPQKYEKNTPNVSLKKCLTGKSKPTTTEQINNIHMATWKVINPRRRKKPTQTLTRWIADKLDFLLPKSPAKNIA